jgi:hypothetical protein
MRPFGFSPTLWQHITLSQKVKILLKFRAGVRK